MYLYSCQISSIRQKGPVINYGERGASKKEGAGASQILPLKKKKKRGGGGFTDNVLSHVEGGGGHNKF